MKIFDTIESSGTQITLIDVRAGLMSPTLGALRDIGVGAQAGVVEGARALAEARGDAKRGFDPAADCSQPGLGLSAIAERARLVQAEFSVTSAPGRGTTVAVRVPLLRSAP